MEDCTGKLFLMNNYNAKILCAKFRIIVAYPKYVRFYSESCNNFVINYNKKIELRLYLYRVYYFHIKVNTGS
jgi:hypothetical protein